MRTHCLDIGTIRAEDPTYRFYGGEEQCNGSHDDALARSRFEIIWVSFSTSEEIKRVTPREILSFDGLETIPVRMRAKGNSRI